MGRENARRAHLAHRFVEIHTSRDELANALDEHECRMPLVRVPGGRLDANSAQHPHPADAEDPFLTQSEIRPARVQLARELAILGIILREVRVEEVDRDASDHHPPRPDVNVPAVRLHDGEPRLLTGPENLLERRTRRIELLVRRLLPPIEAEVLVEVSFRVEQADPYERDTEVRRCLAMVAGKHAEATGVDRDRVVKPELRAEVRDGTVARFGEVVGEPRVGIRPLAIELPHETIVHLEELRIARDGTEAFRVDPPQDHDWIVPGEVPERLIDRGEQRSGATAPTPRNVHRQRRETLDARREI